MVSVRVNLGLECIPRTKMRKMGVEPWTFGSKVFKRRLNSTVVSYSIQIIHLLRCTLAILAEYLGLNGSFRLGEFDIGSTVVRVPLEPCHIRLTAG